MKSQAVKPIEIFQNYFPDPAVAYCFDLWRNYDFRFKISKSRKSKLGDYRFHLHEKAHTITVNGDLNPFAFLVTYLHELAHLMVQIQYGSRVEPHGEEWKLLFRKVAQPMLTQEVFPEKVLKAFQRYLINPKASSCADTALLLALEEHNPAQEGIYLTDVPFGKTFEFNGKSYLKENLRRSRFICKEMISGKKYLISKIAKVQMIEH
jgi:SprT protein